MTIMGGLSSSLNVVWEETTSLEFDYTLNKICELHIYH